MFLLIDESKPAKQDYICFGCLCVEDDTFYNAEAKALKGRVEAKLWGEMKWSKLGGSQSGYSRKYQQLFETYMAEPKLTFHSYAYDTKLSSPADKVLMKDPDRPFKQAYTLIKSVIKKCQNYGYKDESYYIIADDFQGASDGYKQIRGFLEKDKQVLPGSMIEFCSVANSAVITGLQVADICTGIISTKISKVYKLDEVHRHKTSLIQSLENLNSEYKLGDIAEGGVPSLYDGDKSHHFYVQRP